jgi:hypothetical protein
MAVGLKIILQAPEYAFGAFTMKTCKNTCINFTMSVNHLSACNKLRTIKWIFIKFDRGKFYENVSTYFSFD